MLPFQEIGHGIKEGKLLTQEVGAREEVAHFVILITNRIKAHNMVPPVCCRCCCSALVSSGRWLRTPLGRCLKVPKRCLRGA